MFKSLFRSAMLVAVGAAGALVLPPLIKSRAPVARTAVSAPTIEHVRDLSALVTTSVDVADVQVTGIEGWTGGIQVALLLRGDYLLGTDLSQSEFESVNQHDRTAVLILTPPNATSPRLDHDRTRLFGISAYGLWELVPSDRAQVVAINRAMQEAQASLATAADDPAQLERARRQAEAVLGCFFRALGWEVTIRWSDRA